MIKDWNQELTPWAAPAVFGKVPFGNGAEKTLEFITSRLLPEVQENIPHLILGGYSLAGLFALWSGYQTDKFDGIVAKNPVMAQVGNAIRRQNELLTGQMDNTILEWNPGNHFVDSEKRTAKGFAWVMDKCV